MKRALIITDCFPPEASGGRLRSVKFSKYLPEFGWEPEVLTVGRRSLMERDDDTLKEVPEGLRVHRAFAPDPVPLVKSLGRWLEEKLGGRARQSGKPPREGEPSLDAGGKGGLPGLKPAVVGPMKACWRWARVYLWFPDYRVFWAPFAVLRAFRLHRREPYDAFITTAPDYSTFIVGWWMKRLTGTPWVADYRDLWTGNHARLWMSPGRARFEARLERRLVRRADHLVAVSPGFSEHIRRLHADFPPERIHVITNGYDDDFPDLRASAPAGDVFTVSYTGVLYGHRPVGSFLSALGRLLCERDGLRPSVRVNFYGKVRFDKERTLGPIIDKYRIAPMVSFEPYIKYEEALRAQAASSVNLLIVEDTVNSDSLLPLKAFEYLASGRPVLALAPEGDCRRLIQESGAGVVCHPRDVEGIKEALEALIEEHSRGELGSKADPSVVSRYHRRELTGRLAGVLDGAIGGPPHDQGDG